MAEEEFASTSDLALPIAALLVPPTASEQQQTQLRELAIQKGVGFAVSVPRNALEAVVAATATLSTTTQGARTVAVAASEVEAASEH